MKSITTKKIYSFILHLSGMFFFISANAQNIQPVNSLIGDISFINTFGYTPVEKTGEDLRIKTHLEFVENILRKKNVSTLSTTLQQKRNHLLDLLHNYRTTGIFPRNYDHKDRRPCFIDKDGRICAVGYLIEQTAGRQVAEAINNKYKYEYVLAMNDKMVSDWITNSGLTKEECAMIQPSYGPYYCYCASKPKINADCALKNNGQWGCKPYHYLKIKEETATTVSFSLEQAERISLKILDNTGRVVKVLADDVMRAGDKEFEWNTENINEGIYLLRLQTQSSEFTRKLVVAK